MKKIKYYILLVLASVIELSSAQTLQGIFISDFSTRLCGIDISGKDANICMSDFLNHSTSVTADKILGLNAISYRKAWLISNGDILAVTISQIEFPGVYVEEAHDSLHKIIFFEFASHPHTPTTILLSSDRSSTLCLALDNTESICEAIMRGRFEVSQTKNDGTKRMAQGLVAIADMMNTILNITLCDEYLTTPVIIKQ